MKRKIWNRCDQCGRFIPIEHFADGRATRIMILPDSAYSYETFETLCKNHRVDPVPTVNDITEGESV